MQPSSSLAAALGVLALVCTAAAVVFAQPASSDKPSAGKPAASQPAAKAPAKPEDDPMHQAWMKSISPGSQHKLMAAMAGNWTVASKFYFAPGAPASEGTGTMVQTMVLGDRYLRQEYKGNSPMGPVEGLGMMGYDNNSGKWVGSWADTWGTGLLNSVGTYDDKSRTWTMAGEMAIPGGLTSKTRHVMTLKDADTIVFRMHSAMPGQPEQLAAEITYTRSK
jgi:hypothetical protein